MTHKEYYAERNRIAEERGIAPTQVGIFEPFPRDKHPYGREDLILALLKTNRGTDLYTIAEQALIDELSPADREARQKRMGKARTDDMKEKQRETIQKKKDPQ